jgi:hypothetical protein
MILIQKKERHHRIEGATDTNPYHSKTRISITNMSDECHHRIAPTILPLDDDDDHITV